MNLPPEVLAAAEHLIDLGAAVTSESLKRVGFRVMDRREGARRVVWIGQQWVLKWDRGQMQHESPRFRRSPDAESRHIAELRHQHGGRSIPETRCIGNRVLIQLRHDPNPRLWHTRQDEAFRLADQLGIGNIHCDNVGWSGTTPMFLDFDYLGPDLTVLLYLKLNTKARTLQGEAPFWATWGERYLARMVRNLRLHLPDDTRLVCLTDRPSVVPDGVEVALLDGDQPGWWGKLNMFRPDVSCGRCLYLDLDNVVAGPLAELRRLTPAPLVMMDDRQMPGLPNASTLLFFAEQVRYLWEDYQADPRGIEARFHETRWPHASDQGYITAAIRAHTGAYPPYFQDALGDGYCLNSRVELEAGAPWEQCQLVFGCWEPKPHESTHPFYARHWT